LTFCAITDPSSPKHVLNVPQWTSISMVNGVTIGNQTKKKADANNILSKFGSTGLLLKMCVVMWQY